MLHNKYVVLLFQPLSSHHHLLFVVRTNGIIKIKLFLFSIKVNKCFTYLAVPAINGFYFLFLVEDKCGGVSCWAF